MSLDPSTQAYIDAMVVKPPQAAINIIDTAIVGLKNAGVWSKLTWLSFLAGNTEQATLLNVVNPAQTLTAVNSPSFTAYQGWQGVPANSAYIEIAPTSALVTLNAGFMFGVITGGTDSAANLSLLGQYTPPTPGNYNWIQPRNSSGDFSARFNNTTNTIASAGGTVLGSHTVVRDGNAVNLYVDGNLKTTDTNSPISLSDAPITLFRQGSVYSDFLCPAIAIGNQALTDQQAEDLHEITRAFVRDMARVPMRHSGVMSVAHGLMMAAGNKIVASGGTITNVGGWRIHTFTSSGNFEVISGSGNVEYLIVAGGGGGGRSGANSQASGGGGAGGLLQGTAVIMPGTSPVTVGGGGAGGTSNGQVGGTGGNSVFNVFGGSTITAYGGGGGSGGAADATSGGSGGGGGTFSDSLGGSAASGTIGQGNGGGTANASGTNNQRGGGGGGGAGAVGVTATDTTGGHGGAGLQSSISGSATWYAGGGGGGRVNNINPAGDGGIGGGGAGGQGAAGTAGTANTGGGGGGGIASSNGADGGSGIVIIRYRT